MDTKTKLLNAAETLIVKQGATHVSMRKITEKAGANVAAVNYHFGSKENLISAVLVRFLTPLHDEQKRNLAAVMDEAGEAPPCLEEIIRSQLEPLYRFTQSHPDWINDFHLITAACDNNELIRVSLKRLAKENLHYLVACLAKALPTIPPMSLLRRVAFFQVSKLGIIQGDIMMEDAIELLNIDRSGEAMLDELTRFIASGLRAQPVQASA